MLPLKLPYKYYISSIYFLHKKFVPSEIQTHFYVNTVYFPHLQVWTFWPHEPKNSNFTNSFLKHYPQPKLNQNSPKDPKLILILTMKLLYTYVWKPLPVCDLICWLAFSKSSQIGWPTLNHIKRILWCINTNLQIFSTHQSIKIHFSDYLNHLQRSSCTYGSNHPKTGWNRVRLAGERVQFLALVSIETFPNVAEHFEKIKIKKEKKREKREKRRWKGLFFTFLIFLFPKEHVNKVWMAIYHTTSFKGSDSFPPFGTVTWCDGLLLKFGK